MSRLPGSMPRNPSRTSNKDKLSPSQVKKIRRADTLVQRGYYKQAERLLDDTQSRLRPPYPLALLQVQGVLNFEMRRFTRANDLFKSIWDREKRNLVAIDYLGRIARKVNRPDVALRFLDLGLSLKSSHQPMQVAYIQSLMDLNRFDEAREHIKRHRDVTPNNPQFLSLTAETHRRTQRLPEAVDYYRQGLEQLIQQPPPGDKSVADAQETFDVERHEDTLWELLAQLKAAGVQAFAAFGTLLGLVRDGQLIGFDKDVDICIPFNRMKQAVACMRENGWQEVKNSMGMVGPRALTHPKKGLAVDVFALMYDRNEQALVTGFMMPHIPWEWNFLIAFPPLHLQKAQSPHGEVWELKNPEAFLEAEYGPGWRESDPYFASFAGEPGLVHFSYLTQCYAYIRCFKYWQAGSFRKMDALLYHMLRHQPGDELLENTQRVVQQHLADEAERQEDEDLLDEKDDAVVH